MINKYLACGWILLSRSFTTTPSPYSSMDSCSRGHRKTCALQMSSLVMSVYPSDRVVTQLPVNMHCKNVTCPVVVNFTHLHQKMLQSSSEDADTPIFFPSLDLTPYPQRTEHQPYLPTLVTCLVIVLLWTPSRPRFSYLSLPD